MSRVAALVLAAGKGTRMRSERPKVLQTVLGESMLACLTASLEPIFGDDIWMVVGHRAEMIRAAFPAGRFVVQEEQLGTGHALTLALPVLRNAGYTHVFIVNGDTPLLAESAVRAFMGRARGETLAFASIVLDDPGGYGRVVRKGGQVAAIVEAKDYDAAVHGPESGEVNAGLYLISLDAAERLLPRLGNANRSGEYYLTDIVGLAVAEGIAVCGVACGRDMSLLGVNSPRELAFAEEVLRRRIVEALMDSGVIVHAPDMVRASPFVVVKAGAELCGPCEISGRTLIEEGARIASHCVIKDCSIGRGAEIRSFSHLEGALVAKGALVGPYARLRPGTELAEEAHVGNFVELKKARLGRGAKANHLTYLGDAQIGAGTNIGAGTITCNYDGKHKYQTHIGENAFIGSNTALIAPVSIGSGAVVGAGSTITKDVPEGNLAISRVKQKTLRKL